MVATGRGDGDGASTPSGSRGASETYESGRERYSSARDAYGSAVDRYSSRTDRYGSSADGADDGTLDSFLSGFDGSGFDGAGFNSAGFNSAPDVSPVPAQDVDASLDTGRRSKLGSAGTPGLDWSAPGASDPLFDTDVAPSVPEAGDAPRSLASAFGNAPLAPSGPPATSLPPTGATGAREQLGSRARDAFSALPPETRGQVEDSAQELRSRGDGLLGRAEDVRGSKDEVRRRVREGRGAFEERSDRSGGVGSSSTRAPQKPQKKSSGLPGCMTIAVIAFVLFNLITSFLGGG